jgi:hypothetical protein
MDCQYSDREDESLDGYDFFPSLVNISTSFPTDNIIIIMIHDTQI